MGSVNAKQKGMLPTNISHIKTMSASKSCFQLFLPKLENMGHVPIYRLSFTDVTLLLTLLMQPDSLPC